MSYMNINRCSVTNTKASCILYTRGGRGGGVLGSLQLCVNLSGSTGLVALTGLVGGLLLLQRCSLESLDDIQAGSGGLERRLRWEGRGGGVLGSLKLCVNLSGWTGLVGLTGVTGGLLLLQRCSLESSDAVQMDSGGLERRLRWEGMGGAVESKGEEAEEEKGERRQWVMAVII